MHIIAVPLLFVDIIVLPAVPLQCNYYVVYPSTYIISFILLLV